MRDSKQQEQELIVECGVRARNDGVSSLSAKWSVPVHELCSKPEADFESVDIETYNAWCDATLAEMHVWFTTQYAQLSAAAVTVE